ncbi:hypothetical protein BHM03_00051177 [Ensete ventricosum]|nr:hypothetical protein BHM03_00051177 [Ensete ventricosum]
MEKKQGFLPALREEEVGKGPSPTRSREKGSVKSQAPLPQRRRKGRRRHPSLSQTPEAVAPVAWSKSSRETLAPLMEGPDGSGGGGARDAHGDPRKEGWGRWIRGQLSRAPSAATSSVAAGAFSSALRSDLRLLLGVMGAPLAPVHVSSFDPLPNLSVKDTPIVSFSVSSSSSNYYLSLCAAFFRSSSKSCIFLVPKKKKK